MKRAASDSVTVRVVAFKEGDVWVAQGVDYAIAAHADDLPSLLPAFERAVLRNVSVNMELGRSGLEGIPAAPPRFAEMFDAPDGLDLSRAAAPRRNGRPAAPVRVDSLRVVEARAA